jgi:hypothetical protein
MLVFFPELFEFVFLNTTLPNKGGVYCFLVSDKLLQFVRCEVLTATSIKMTDYAVASYSLVGIDRRFRGAYIMAMMAQHPRRQSPSSSLWFTLNQNT